MGRYEKKIKNYNKYIEETYIKEKHIDETIKKVRAALPKKEDKILPFLEFIYCQSKYIKKQWWILQSVVLFVLWVLLSNMDNGYYADRLLGVGAAIFVSLIMPEMWRNRGNISLEIENASFYSLRQIYSARIIVFSIIDILILSVFVSIAQIDILNFIINFMIPFNVCLAICFKFLSDSKKEMLHSLLAFAFWTIIWILILSSNILYAVIVFPLWSILLIISFIYLSYCIRKMQKTAFILEEIL